ncbi:MAG: hypothetical protein M3R13_07640 [Armatimonadota bacterium]|nr:hypothetical protein [Armatimonadota bacterium]
MRAIAIVTAAFLSFAAYAQYEQFVDLPETHWVYETLAKLSQENVIPHRPIFRTGRPEDRMELATWTLHACSAMLWRLERAEHAYERSSDGINHAKEDAAFLRKLAKETDNLAKMAFLFEPELKKRHIDAMALRREMLSFPKRIERIADLKTGETLPGGITGQDNPLVINSSGAVMQFNIAKRAFDELHVVPIERHMRLIELESSKDRYALVLQGQSL